MANSQSMSDSTRTLIRKAVRTLLQSPGVASVLASVPTIGFEALGMLTGKDAKSLMRMLGPKGNPQARNLFDVIAHLQEREGVHFHVHPARETVAQG